MSDLISREAAIEALRRAEALTRAFGYHNVIGTIRDLPTIDAVEVVRCGECKHYNDGWCYNPNTYDDEKTRGNTSPDWYCADGERKGEEDERLRDLC